MLDIAERLIETLLQDNWTQTPLAFDNVNFAPVLGVDFVRVQIEWTTSANIGPSRIRHDGLVLLSVMVQPREGTRQSAKYASDLIRLFQDNSALSDSDTYLTFKAGYAQRVGEREGWYQRNIVIPFVFDYCK
jgi:hypothetical protein